MKPEEMNEGVRILLGRMDTHPEEFNYGVIDKWSDIVGEIVHRAKGEPNMVPFLDDDEVKAIYDKLRDLERHEFTAQVLRRLADTPEEDFDPDQLGLPYIPAVPKGRTVTLTRAEMERAKALGVSPEVFVEAKRKNELGRIYGQFKRHVRKALK